MMSFFMRAPGGMGMSLRILVVSLSPLMRWLVWLGSEQMRRHNFFPRAMELCQV